MAGAVEHAGDGAGIHVESMRTLAACLIVSGHTLTRVRQPCVRRVNFAGASWGVLNDISAGQVRLQRSDLYVGLT